MDDDFVSTHSQESTEIGRILISTTRNVYSKETMRNAYECDDMFWANIDVSFSMVSTPQV